MPALDLLSTSQTLPRICPFGAPFAALVVAGAPMLTQTCCNHWECPVCGFVRARQEYRRVVYGCELLAKTYQLYFWTLTCRGREISLEEAEENYYAWTNVLLTNARKSAKSQLAYWCYVQITERQKKTRNHPHSHIITTFCPSDAINTTDANGRGAIVSEWFSRANATSGLGSQHRISLVKNASAVSRYVAKYMFKSTMQETFPPKWKRIRYSEKFPKLPVVTPEVVIVLRRPEDWRQADLMPLMWQTSNEVIYEMALHRIARVTLTQLDRVSV